MVWKPIETAPRDGSWFIVCRAGENDSYEVGCYSPLMGDKFVEAGEGLYRKEKQSIYDWNGFDNFHRATHWMPLLPIPAASVSDI